MVLRICDTFQYCYNTIDTLVDIRLRSQQEEESRQLELDIHFNGRPSLRDCVWIYCFVTDITARASCMYPYTSLEDAV